MSGYEDLEEEDQEEVDESFGGSGGATKTKTPAFTSSPVAPVAFTSMATPVGAFSSSPSKGTLSNDDSLQNEMDQILGQWNSTRDGCHLAKLSCIIFKACQEATQKARFDPKLAAHKMTQVASFFGYKLTRLPEIWSSENLAGLGSLIARSSAVVLSFARDESYVSPLARALNSWSLRQHQDVATYTVWTDACEIAKKKNQPRKSQPLVSLLTR